MRTVLINKGSRQAVLAGIAGACMFASAGMAQAEPFQTSLSGYGTVGAVITDTNEAQFRSNFRQHHGADKSADVGVDSRLGVQGSVIFNETFSAVGQLLGSRRDGETGVGVEWFYGEAKLTPNMAVRVGRMVMPTFVFSDSRNVGYAAHWLRAPMEVYDYYPYTSFDGVQANYTSELAGTNVKLTASTGKLHARVFAFGTGFEVKYPKIYAVSAVAERGNFSARVSAVTNEKTELVGLPLPQFRDTFMGGGLQYDNGKWLAVSEYTVRRNDHGNLIDSDAYYVSSGYRFGTVMPFATYSHFKPRGSTNPIPTSQYTVSAGARWDAFKNTALKLQADWIHGNGSQFINSTPAFAASKPTVRVVSFAADFVF